MKSSRRIGRLYVIANTVTGNRFDESIDALRLTLMAVAGGAEMIQIRCKGEDPGTLLETAKRAGNTCRAWGVPLIVNDSIDVAMESGADGVHVGRADAPVAEARRAGGEHFIVGASAGSLEEAREAEALGADYVGFGHIFPTASKDKPSPPVGVGALATVCSAVTIPVIAIGGIDASNIDSVLEAGAYGVAVIGAVAYAEDPEEATRALRSRIEKFSRR